jgi:hypothetical protein
VSNAFTQPARQAMIPEIVGTERIMNAIGLNVFAMNTMRLAAPAIAGGLIATISPAWVFVVMSGLYALAVVTMFRVPARSKERVQRQAAAARASTDASGGGVLRDVRDALVYLRGHRVLRMLLIVHIFLGTFSLPYQRLLPGFVDDVLSDSADETAVRIGLLLTMTAVGALVGSFTIASLPSRNRGKLLIGSISIFGVALLCFSVSTLFVVSALVAMALGFGQAGRQSLNNILIQSNVSEEFRGRVTSVMLLEDGIESLGIFGVALIAASFGLQFALGLVACALLALAATLWFVTPAYRRLQ